MNRAPAVVERRGGGTCATTVTLLDHPWKSDDRDWFKWNPERTHRVRSPFPNEVEIETPTGYVPLILVRQVETRFSAAGRGRSQRQFAAAARRRSHRSRPPRNSRAA